MKTSRMLSGVIAGVLAASLLAPAAAYAIPGRGTPRFGAPKPSANATRQANAAKRLEVLQHRIEVVLERREAAFNRIADHIATRITKVSAIADKVEAAGGDVSGVRTSLDEARRLLVQARAEEAEAIEMFGGMLTASNKGAAFKAARLQAKTAVATLKQARVTLRNAVLNLRSIANGLKGAQ
jgi:hypothetical protein